MIPTGSDSDHAGANNGSGPSWVASVVNAIGNSSYWKNIAIIITWDDWGGWYTTFLHPVCLSIVPNGGAGMFTFSRAANRRIPVC